MSTGPEKLKFELIYAILRIQLLEAKKSLIEIEAAAKGKNKPLRIIKGGGETTPREKEHLKLVN